jgi:hypothetical protein
LTDLEWSWDIEADGDLVRLKGQICNQGTVPMVGLRLQWVDAATGVEFAPAFWSDNFFTLLGGESRQLEAWVEASLLTGSSRIKCSVYGAKEKHRLF